MMFLTVFILVRPVYAGIDRLPNTGPQDSEYYQWMEPPIEQYSRQTDSIVFNNLIERYKAYHKDHLLLFREYFGPGRFCRNKNKSGEEPDEKNTAK
jgi:hypothetical protein